ncbi:MAG: hypothetical protein UY97_C0011G0035 [Parcubacteria group bacterium GW2011_GWB1_57_6]|nr:MAG: hypothetical protein UY97_C0011G0035 [Parcubacteria group bacterium GW2011_GWB1_57_6]
MRRTFLAKRNALLSSTNISWGALALVLALFLLCLRLVAPNLFWSALAPVFRLSDAVAARSHVFFSSFGNAAALALQNETLRNTNAALALQNQALLQKIDGISGLQEEHTGIIAGITARPPASPYDTLVLAAGSADGVQNGMEVFAADGVPLGIISSVLEDFSRATLFSSPGMSVSGWVGRAHLPLAIKGAGAGAMNASVPRSAGIAAGDIVFAPGPGMLPIGTVVRIDSEPSSRSIILRILPAQNPFSIGWVLIRDTGTSFRAAVSSTTPFMP